MTATPAFSNAPDAEPRRGVGRPPVNRVCPECEGEFALRFREPLPDHQVQIITKGGVQADGDEPCAGSGQRYVGWA
jgi:hypothetical protein